MPYYHKIILFVVAGILFLSLTGGVWLYLSYKNFDPKDKFEVVAEDLVYFPSDYEESRIAFRQLSRELQTQYKRVESFQIPIASSRDSSLTIDGCYLPGKKPDKLLILISGTHGTEAYTGAAMQQLFAREYLDTSFLSKSALLMIHGLNPYGFKYNRRVTENNVDLNRNGVINPATFDEKNDYYSTVYSMLNPDRPVDLNDGFHSFFVFHALRAIAKYGMNTLRQAILRGQYEYPEGIYFGGGDFEQNILGIRNLLDSLGRKYNTIMAIDLHTGYGQRGDMHLFINPVDSEVKNRLNHVFGGFKIDWGTKSDFYTVSGALVDFIGNVYAEKAYIPMVFEFGTLNTNHTMGSLKSLHNTILENQGVQYGYARPEDSMEVSNRFRNMFYPDSDNWKSGCAYRFREVMDVALYRYLEL